MEQKGSQVNDAGFIKRLKKRYRIVKMPSNGNCLFSAFAKSFHKSKRYHKKSRGLLAGYVDIHFDDIVEFFDLDNQDLRNELATIGKVGKWGGDLAIYAACNVYVCVVHVLEPNNPTKIFHPMDPLEPPSHIYLSYHNGNHYNLLIPRNPTSTSSTVSSNHDANGESSSQSQSSENEDDDNSSEAVTSDDEKDCDDDLSFNSDASDMDDDDSSSHSESSEMDVDERLSSTNNKMDNPILSEPSFPFTAHGFFKRSRAAITIAILVPIPNLKHVNLLEVVQKETLKKVYFVTLYNPTNILQLCSDADISSVFTVYTQKYLVPINFKMHDRAIWLSNALIIPILLSVVGFSWKNITISTMCKKTNCSKPVEILNSVWSKVRVSVMEDMDYILANTEDFFCVNCSKRCPHIYKPWHTDLSKYLVQKITSDNEEFGKIFSTFDHPNYFHMAPIMTRLVDIFDSGDLIQDKWTCLKNELDDNAKRRKDYYYSTYLVLHLDGIGMSKYGKEDVLQMLQDSNIRKAVYAGRASNKAFRETHFVNPTSSIYKALTRTSRLYYIRKQVFTNLSEAQLDEAIIIEILKVYLNWIQQNEGLQPFLLMNIRSENCCILPTEKKEKEQINAFAKSEYPIFRTDPTDLRQFNYARFPGNYIITEPITMLPGGYELRNFLDQEIQDYYAELEGRRPK